MCLANQTHSTPCPQDLASKLREAEEIQSTLQAECDQYRTILAETVSCKGLPMGGRWGGEEAHWPSGKEPCVPWSCSCASPGPFLWLNGKGDA